MARDPEVDAWFDALDHPLKDVMFEVRKATTGHVQVMFHQGAKLPGSHPGLEGGGGTVRYIRFRDGADVRGKRDALRAAVAAWIQLRAG